MIPNQTCHCAKLFINNDVKIVINSNAAKSVNKIPVLLTETQCLQGFFYVLRVKKDLADFTLQGLNLILNFAYWLLNGFALNHNRAPNYLDLIAACAAASLAIGTLNGEQDT